MRCSNASPFIARGSGLKNGLKRLLSNWCLRTGSARTSLLHRGSSINLDVLLLIYTDANESPIRSLHSTGVSPIRSGFYLLANYRKLGRFAFKTNALMLFSLKGEKNQFGWLAEAAAEDVYVTGTYAMQPPRCVLCCLASHFWIQRRCLLARNSPR